jgi:hypothetical protein
LETPYLREDRRGRRGRRRHTRGPYGAGCYPVLEALGIADRVSPATRSEIALHVVQAASYREAAAMLARRGLSCDVSSLVRISTATAEASTRLRDAALAAALRVPVPSDGPLAGKRVRVSLDGGRVRLRHPSGGRQPAGPLASRHPGVSLRRRDDILDDRAARSSGFTALRCPSWEVEAIWALLIGYLRLLGAAYADVVECIADGAEWIGKRMAPAHARRDSCRSWWRCGFLPRQSISLRNHRDLPRPTQSPTPSAIQALAACVAAPDRWG